MSQFFVQHLHQKVFITEHTIQVDIAEEFFNSFPTGITALTSLPTFKRQLKTFLFTKSFPSV